jgi:hypothetical protein
LDGVEGCGGSKVMPMLVAPGHKERDLKKHKYNH